ncbi:type I DNA topoisomerase [Wenxinia saemankumensis]|uniref:DNA topoisomerase 1 n=1 Tax=Wenxinia saemankumensis TaxID=1447782 RepID=A0A1M6GVD9_9RHOB|nr:type I DNA topoisomerase [Wenxinia saemankumensis]SHJ13933.1 DNA topoisomerase I [Wenxinia saemankumensis]
MPVVVVESPAKAKTINKYLGPGYTVLASYGHVRDLPPKDGSVDPEHDFEMKWEVASDSQKHVRAIAEALKDDNALILATDPDREGEAISWHLQEALTKRRAIRKDTDVKRVTFNAITKSAVEKAMAAPRQVDAPLVEAYLARRALDYLVGFNLSPVLWRKLPGAKSAGRVQSVCLRLIVEREMEIEAFRPVEYWSVKALLATPRGDTFEARLTTLGGKRLERHDLKTRTDADMAVQAVTSRELKVKSVEAKPGTRNPAPPFMTSTLQQEASRKFGMGAKATMSAAQRLYEAGLITYMRTDGIDMAPEAVMSARDAIRDRFGEAYLPKSPRMYKNKAKNAQEAHECIRPTDMSLATERLRIAEADQRKIYDLIWKRTLASQMEAAKLERTTVEIASADGQVGLRATGQRIVFDGFIAIYVEGRDEPSGEDDDAILPRIEEGEVAAQGKGSLAEAFAKAAEKGDGADALVETDGSGNPHAILSKDEGTLALQHHTQPPPRYTEATLVKKMEELGIGRPSTYASIVTTIQDRGYVQKDKNRLIAQDKGRLVTAFLSNYFKRYVDYDFTADLEEDLDRVSAGESDYKQLLARFWRDFSAAIAETSELRITEVLDKINEVLEPHLFPPTPDGTDPRLCPNCGAGRLSMRTARSGGAFIGCSNYPECRYTRPFGPPGMAEEGTGIGPDGKILGEDQGEKITLRDGRFGPYVQRGEPTEEAPKPPRASLPKGWSPSDIDLEKALMLLNLPREIGPHPEDGMMISAGIGRYGPFVAHDREDGKKTYANLKDVEDVFTIGMNRAVEELATKAARRGGARAAAKVLKDLGEHPEGGAMQILEGRYGPYIKWEKVNATIPKGTAPEDVNEDMALELIAEKAKKSGKKPTKKAAVKKTTKTAAKKTTKKETTAGKTTAKKAPAGKSAGTGKTAGKSAKPDAAKDAGEG